MSSSAYPAARELTRPWRPPGWASAVTFIGKVGSDFFGDQAIAGYQKEGIDVAHIFRSKDMPTGVALIMVDRAGENLISVASGANHALTAGDIEEVADVIRSASVLMLQLETAMEPVIAAAQIAHRANVPVILDPAPAPNAPLDPALLKCVSFLTPNEGEASRLTGIAIDDEASARVAAQKLLAAGPSCVILTLGVAGALVCTSTGTAMVESFPVDAVDSTAAGDAFNGGLAAALAAGKALDVAVVEACACGALADDKDRSADVPALRPAAPRLYQHPTFSTPVTVLTTNCVSDSQTISY